MQHDLAVSGSAMMMAYNRPFDSMMIHHNFDELLYIIILIAVIRQLLSDNLPSQTVRVNSVINASESTYLAS